MKTIVLGLVVICSPTIFSQATAQMNFQAPTKELIASIEKTLGYPWTPTHTDEDGVLRDFIDLLQTVHKAAPPKTQPFVKKQLPKKTFYNLTLGYNMLWHHYHKDEKLWWSLTVPKLYLGAIPLEKHLPELKALDIGLVISMLEDHEHEPGIIANPMTAEKWEAENIKFLSLPTIDFDFVAFTDLHQGVEAIKDMIKTGQSVYVHCKAGKGRSASVVLAYIATRGGYSYDDAFEFLRKQRRIISLKPNKQEAIEAYSNLFWTLYAPTEGRRQEAAEKMLWWMSQRLSAKQVGIDTRP